MKKTKLILSIAGIGILVTLLGANICDVASLTKKKSSSAADVRDGDIIFQTNISPQCLAIQLATGSEWSHVGIVLKENNEWMVLEAVQPVKMTPLNSFINRGEKDVYVLKRLIDETILTDKVVEFMHEFGKEQLGKNYDGTFMWSDDEMYCSELVWKIYFETTGLEIGALQPLGDFDLTHPLVREKLEERYGPKIPLDEKMISPGAMFESNHLKTVE